MHSFVNVQNTFNFFINASLNSEIMSELFLLLEFSQYNLMSDRAYFITFSYKVRRSIIENYRALIFRRGKTFMGNIRSKRIMYLLLIFNCQPHVPRNTLMIFNRRRMLILFEVNEVWNSDWYMYLEMLPYILGNLFQFS